MAYSKNTSTLSLRKKILQLLQHHNGKVNIGQLHNLLDLKECEQSCKQMFLQEKKQFKRKIQQARRQCRQTKYDLYHLEDHSPEVHFPDTNTNSITPDTDTTPTTTTPTVQEETPYDNIFTPTDDPLVYQGTIFENMVTEEPTHHWSPPSEEWLAWENFCQQQDYQYHLLLTQTTDDYDRSGKRKHEHAFPTNDHQPLLATRTLPRPITV